MSKNYVIDTCVYIDNPECLFDLHDNENQIFIPNQVLLELDKLKKDTRIGYLAKRVIKHLEENRHQEWLHFLPESSPHKDGDTAIINEITKTNQIDDPILVSSDSLFRLRAEMVSGLKVEDYKDSLPFQSESEMYTGINDDPENIVMNSFVWESGKPVFHGDGYIDVVDYTNEVWTIKPKTVYQNLAMSLMLNDKLDVITIQSTAGFGKTFLALATAMHLVLEKKLFKKIVVVKSPVELGHGLGYRPGDVDEKLAPIMKPVTDLIYKLHDIRPANRLFANPKKVEEGFNTRKFEILPLNFVQGLNLDDTLLVIDEAQNLSRAEMRAILTRCGENTKAFVVGDTKQVINPFLNAHNNGINWITKLMKGEKGYGHMVLSGTKSRGPVTDLVLKVGL